MELGRIGRSIAIASLALAQGCAGRAGEGQPKVADQAGAKPEATAASATAVDPNAGPKHIILLVGDGMQLEHEVAASRYLHGDDWSLSWRQWPQQAYCSTWDVTTYDQYADAVGAAHYDSRLPPDPTLGYDPARGGVAPFPVSNPGSARAYFEPSSGQWPATDSAASATALATGQKTNKGRIAWHDGDPERGPLTTLAERLRAERGMAIGAVTTVPFSHATPAAFLSHNLSRHEYHAIADEIITRTKPEVVVGGGVEGSKYLSDQSRAALKAQSDLVFVERAKGVDGGKALLEAAGRATKDGKRLFGLFGGPQGNFDFRRVDDAPGAPKVGVGSPENPSLAQAAEAALSVLSADEDGFFLVVEQGDIDWANHANNYAHMIGSVADLDEAVRAIARYIERPGDALEWSNTLVLLTSDHANSHLRLNDEHRLGAGDLPEQSETNCGGNCVYPGGELSYSTQSHTNELVTLSGIGLEPGQLEALFSEHRGALYPGTRIVDNTAIYSMMVRAAGL